MIYERESDLSEEQSVKEYIEAKKKVRLIKSSKFSRFDFYMTDLKTNLIALVEIKSRRSASNTYPTFFISTDKINDILFLKRHYGKKGFVNNETVDLIIFVKFLDKIMYWKHNPEVTLTCSLGGNAERKQEMMTHIPMEVFKEI